ncbi:GNAT family N-acetyltransferase [Aestuariibaculum suncheonense]|uniref:GNAT family N-acetyltransferase n=1 Tax=Aestuariibaculum suncheonense TaxID=1028745 RepID=A0A8J6QEN0_9FLAO|nr:GNAT family N-acetyltransferase [Aestuariibaculum suncheonense]MBD0834396.1 GNAT family N-acetyltransferase [Aestuariibaculum suncheonense]
MTLTFHQIHRDEFNTVLNLFKEAAEKIAKMHIDHWQYWKNPPAEKIKWVQDGIKNNEYFFIKNTSNTTIGMVRILNEDHLYWGDQKDAALYVHSLMVKTEYNGQGIGKTILKSIEEQAKAKSCNYLRLDADSKNPKLCGYYEHLGFNKVGEKVLPISTYNLYQKEIL